MSLMSRQSAKGPVGRGRIDQRFLKERRHQPCMAVSQVQSAV